MQRAIARKLGLPRYLKIASVLRHEIAENHWSLGDRLPSINALAKRFGVAPPTARQAIRYLEGLGVVQCRHGTGTYVSGPSLRMQPFRVRRNLGDWSNQIEMPKLIDLSQPAMVQPDLPDSLEPAQSYQLMYRLFEFDGQPAMIIETYLDRALYDVSPAEYDAKPALALVLERMGHGVQAEQNYLTVDLADEEIADKLNLIPLAPVGRSRLVLKNQANVAVYASTMIYPAEMIRIEFEE